MEQWNREELYKDVWDQPVSRLTGKYGISGVAIAKACRKLDVPLPGRGYWARKQAGQTVRRDALPAAKDLPIIWRMKMPPPEGSAPQRVGPAPTDSEWLRITEMEGRTLTVPGRSNFHELVRMTREGMSGATPDYRGVSTPPWSAKVLDVRVSKESLPRALRFLNAVVQTLYAEGFEIIVPKERRRAEAKVFGQLVSFAVVEKTTVVGKRTVQEYSWTRQESQYQPTGRLTFRVGASGWTPEAVLGDGVKRRVETMVPQAIGAIMREARSLRIREEQRRQEQIAEMQRARERAALAETIQEEEKRVEELKRWTENWAQAARMRKFVSALEESWKGRGQDLAPGTDRGRRILWMRQQADRLDPLVVEKPASILDRQQELKGAEPCFWQ
jgi:hypothetical protein